MAGHELSSGSDAGLRRLQLALAAFWAIDALLQLQPDNFSRSLIFGTILGNAENQPQPIYGSLVWASHVLGPYPVQLNIAIIAIQASIAAGLVWPRTVKPALGISIAWALGVWWLGEGFGGIFAGKATLLVGAPGAALLYAVLALVAWPGRRRSGGSVAGAGALGEGATRGLWALLWIGGAILRVVPFWFPPVYALAGDFQLGLDQEPHWLFRVNESLSHLATAAGLPLVIGVAATEVVIGVGVLTRFRRTFLAAGIVLATVYWVFGQQLAQLLTGQATDVAAGPLYILLALTIWPRRRDHAKPADAETISKGNRRLALRLRGWAGHPARRPHARYARRCRPAAPDTARSAGRARTAGARPAHGPRGTRARAV